MAPSSRKESRKATFAEPGNDAFERNPDDFVGMTGDAFLDKPWYERMHPIHVPLLTLTPVLAIYGVFTADWIWQTYLFAVLYYAFTGLGITAGYHRLFAHKAYKAHWTLRWLMMLMGSGAVEGSLRWWARDHRAHHKYVDTDQDPYSSKKGFFYSHVGWMLVRQDKAKIGAVNISDLESDPMVMFQHRNYPWFALGMGVVFPTAVCGLGWGDWYGGFFIAAIARLVFVHHSTFCVNSLAHWAGEQGFSDAHTSRDSVITAVVTLGEGYHNFHHEFPNDYRNAIRWWQYDPTKWLIATLAFFGFAYDLHQFDQDLIGKNMVQMQAKKLNWGKDATAMESLTMDEVEKRVKAGAKLLVLDGFAVDVADFAHPGGAGYVTSNLGKDCTRMMRGETYKHSNSAHNIALVRRIGFVTDAPSFELSTQALRAAAIAAGKKPHSY